MVETAGEEVLISSHLSTIWFVRFGTIAFIWFFIRITSAFALKSSVLILLCTFPSHCFGHAYSQPGAVPPHPSEFELRATISLVRDSVVRWGDASSESFNRFAVPSNVGYSSYSFPIQDQSIPHATGRLRETTLLFADPGPSRTRHLPISTQSTRLHKPVLQLQLSN